MMLEKTEISKKQKILNENLNKLFLEILNIEDLDINISKDTYEIAHNKYIKIYDDLLTFFENSNFKTIKEQSIELKKLSKQYSYENMIKLKNIKNDFIEHLKKNNIFIENKNLNTDLKKIKQKIITELIEKYNINSKTSNEKEKSFDKIPEEIRDEIIQDYAEIEKTFNCKAYKSTIIMCAKILETALFRKYFEISGKDLLETSPGYGLGKLIAELRKDDLIDPGITQQIHLINQVRIFSVHKKKELFIATENQTKAIVLYTKDILDKLWK